MSEPYLGQIVQGGWNFAPRNFQMCNGAIMSIAQNSALFSLLGTTYGGNGQTTFGLPDLRGRVMVGAGQGPGLRNYSLGELSGSESTTLTINNMPTHTHPATFTATASMNAAQAGATAQQPAAGDMLGRSRDGSTIGSSPEIYAPSGSTPAVALGGLNVAGTVQVGAAGGSLPFDILQPFLAITVVIAVQGLFPSRN